MLLGGFWHGASWNFLVWGAIFGVWLAFERLLGKIERLCETPAAVAGGADFSDRQPRLGVLPGGRPLRGEPIPRVALQSRRRIECQRALAAAPFFTNPAMSWSCSWRQAIAFFGVQAWDLSRNVTPLRATLALAVLAWSLVAMSAQSFNPFLYFQF